MVIQQPLRSAVARVGHAHHILASGLSAVGRASSQAGVDIALLRSSVLASSSSSSTSGRLRGLLAGSFLGHSGVGAGLLACSHGVKETALQWSLGILATLHSLACAIDQSDAERLIARAKVDEPVLDTDAASCACSRIGKHGHSGLLSLHRLALPSDHGESNSRCALSKVRASSGAGRSSTYLASEVVVPLSAAAATLGSEAKGSGSSSITRQALLGRIVARVSCAIDGIHEVGACIAHLSTRVVSEHGSAPTARIHVAFGRLLALAWPLALGAAHLGFLAHNWSTSVSTKLGFAGGVDLRSIENAIFRRRVGLDIRASHTEHQAFCWRATLDRSSNQDILVGGRTGACPFKGDGCVRLQTTLDWDCNRGGLFIRPDFPPKYNSC